MVDRKSKNIVWRVLDERGNAPSTEYAQLAVLMDIRDERQALNARLSCVETLRIPRYLRRIASNAAKPRRKRK